MSVSNRFKYKKWSFRAVHVVLFILGTSSVVFADSCDLVFGSNRLKKTFVSVQRFFGEDHQPIISLMSGAGISERRLAEAGIALTLLDRERVVLGLSGLLKVS